MRAGVDGKLPAEYFLTINRDLRVRKTFTFKVQSFRGSTGSGGGRRGAARFKKPAFSGFVQMERLGADSPRYEPFRFWKSLDEEQSPVFPRDVETTSKIELLDEKAFKRLVTGAGEVVFSAAAPGEERAIFRDLLGRYGVGADRVVEMDFCAYCSQSGVYTPVPGKEAFSGYNGEKICKECAGRELLKFVKLHLPVTKNLKNVLRSLLLKFRDVDRVSKMFTPSFDPSRNEEMTLYDEISPARTGRVPTPPRLEELPLPGAVKDVLREAGVERLTPVQAMAVDAGALRGEDLLVVSATSSGKTLVGELCGVPKLGARERRERRRTFIYLVPLVALANQRYREYRDKYRPLGLRVALRVGTSRVGGRKPERGPKSGADIVVGTYEAVDFLLRSGRSRVLGDPGTVVVDEIQMIGDPERGYLLDGFLARMKHLFPRTQFVFLSATVANPRQLAGDLRARLVEYRGRPVPLERHLVVCASTHEKLRMLGLLVDVEFKKRSKFGYRGQSIVFTYSRKHCQELAAQLSQQGVRAMAYHGGLTPAERNRVEALFQHQKVAAVVTTAALGAGVDLPASQVVFESLAMGLDWITIAEFEQMSGRAGRLGKHERGKVVILAESDKTYNAGQTDTEEKVALRVLGGKMRPLGLVPDTTMAERELLAFLAMLGEVPLEDVYRFRGRLMNSEFRVQPKLREFQGLGLLELKAGGEGEPSARVTPLGRAMALSFFTVARCLEVIGALGEIGAEESATARESSLKELVVDLEPLKNVYLTNRVVKELARQRKQRGGKTSNHFFSQAGKAFLDANSVAHKKRLKGWLLQVYLRWVQDLFTCTCENKPDCNCGRRNLERAILDMKLAGRDLDAIARALREKYEVMLYRGDLLDYFDSLVHVLNAVARLAGASGITWVSRYLRDYLKGIEA
ncbi:MAG: DEAD/DEAH box helicase [Promethearchaeota archaeon]